MKFLLFSIAFILTPYAVSAQTLSQYLINNQEYIQSIDKKFTSIFLRAYPDCNNEIKIKRLKPKEIVKTHFSFDDFEDKDNFKELNKRHPEYGQWIEKAIGHACDKKIRLNILSIAFNSEKKPLVYPLLNGRTNIHPLYQSTAQMAVDKILTNNKNCRSPNVVIDTQFLGYRSLENKTMTPKNQNVGWFEQWVVDTCNIKKTVNLAVLPDPRTQYRYIAQVRE